MCKDLFVYYLNADACSKLNFDTIEERDELVINHKEVEIYPVKEFFNEFNNGDFISDLGQAILVKGLDIEGFIEKYDPIMEDDDIRLFETFGADLEVVTKQDPECVWTLLEDGGDEDSFMLYPGVRKVNRLNYVITKKPWENNVLPVRY